MNPIESSQKILIEEHYRGALWLGDYESVQDEEALLKRGILTVITVAAELPVVYKQIRNIRYNVEDKISQDISKFFDKASKDIDSGLSRGGVLGIRIQQLVHCAAGISRSATIVISYLMISRNLDLIEARNLVKKKRPCIQPNDGFMQQLMKLQSELFKRKKLPQRAPLPQISIIQRNLDNQQYYKAITKQFSRRASFN